MRGKTTLESVVIGLVYWNFDQKKPMAAFFRANTNRFENVHFCILLVLWENCPCSSYYHNLGIIFTDLAIVSNSNNNVLIKLTAKI